MRFALVYRFFCLVFVAMPTGRPRRIEATADGQPIFATFSAESPEWLNIRQYNRLRLTGHGLDGHGESFDVGTTIDAVVIRYR